LNKYRITLLDFYIGILIIVISNILPSIDNGPFSTEIADNIYPVKAMVLKNLVIRLEKSISDYEIVIENF